MKNSLKISGITLFMSSMSVGLFAQIASKADDNRVFKIQNIVSVEEKSTPVYLGDKNHQVAVLESDFPKVARRFSIKFPAATDQLWIKEGSALFAYFSNNGNRVSAVYTSRGYLNYSIETLKLSDIPENIALRIKRDYNYHSISNAREITTPFNTIYEVLLENACELIMLQMDKDEMAEINVFRKDCLQ